MVLEAWKDPLVIATLSLSFVTVILAGATVYSTLTFKKEESINRELNWIEKQIENYYSPLLICFNKRRKLLEEYNVTVNPIEKANISNSLYVNVTNISKIYSKYAYIGMSLENYDPDVDVGEFLNQNMLDEKKADAVRIFVRNQLNILSVKHDVLLNKVKKEWWK